MGSGTQHIIRKQSIEINFEVIDDAMHVQDQLADIFYERIQPRMEQLFDEVCGAGEILSVERLEIDCGSINAKHWEDEWVDAVLFLLKQQLVSLPKKRMTSALLNETFFFFVENGTLPWNSKVKTIRELESLVQIDGFFLAKFRELLQSGNCFQRSEQQFSFEFLLQLIQALKKYENETFRQIDADEIIVTQSSVRDVLVSVVKAWVEYNHEVKVQSKMQVERETSDRFKKNSSAVDNAIYIQNAGLVILHPFLTTLFEELRLIKDNVWIDRESQMKAALVLELIVDENSGYPEFDLPLNKILCGLDISEVQQHTVFANQETKIAIDEMLSAVIGHWKVLKNTGVEALRESFLRRQGKLTNRGDSYLLEVESKTIDVLLGHLPWGIAVIQMPWMKMPLYVEWS